MYKPVCFLLAFVVIAVVTQERDPSCSKSRPPSSASFSNQKKIYYYNGTIEETQCFQYYVDPEAAQKPEYANNFRTLRECEDKCNPDKKTAKMGTPAEQCTHDDWMSGPEDREKAKTIYYYQVVDGYSSCEKTKTKRTCNTDSDNCFKSYNKCKDICQTDS